jgi:tryptophan 2,3-dioxygenase
MVRRIIGVDRSIKALDGLPTQVLAGRMTLPLFRKLWEVRAEMTSAWKRDGGYAPGSRRPSGTFPAVPEQASSAPASSPQRPGEQAPTAPAPAPSPSAALAATAASAAPSAPVTATAQALVAAAAQVDPSSVGSAPPQAAPDDPWSRPEPPRRGQAPGAAQPEPPAPAQPASDDPWSRPEPPTSRRMAQLHGEKDSSGGSQEPADSQWAQPPKSPGRF